jgi:transcriptional antiterminator RfaH
MNERAVIRDHIARHSVEDDVAWYLVQVKPNAAHIAERNLSRQGYEVFAPRTRRTVRRAGRFSEQLELVFPGYIFVSARRSGQAQAIGNSLGVQRLVSFAGQKPARVPAALIEALKHNYQNAASSPFREGLKVRVLRGPMTDLVATIDSVAPDRRIWIILDMLGHGTRVRLSAGDLALAH